MRIVTHQDELGRFWAMVVSDDVPDSEAAFGTVLGPAPLHGLGLPKEVEIRLHNQLFSRGIFTTRDIQRRRNEVFAALQAAYRVDVGQIVEAYLRSITREVIELLSVL